MQGTYIKMPRFVMSSLQQQKQYTKQYILPLLNDEEAGSNKHLL